MKCGIISVDTDGNLTTKTVTLLKRDDPKINMYCVKRQTFNRMYRVVFLFLAELNFFQCKHVSQDFDIRRDFRDYNNANY